MREHLATVLAACNIDRRLKTLRDLGPQEAIRNTFGDDPAEFTREPADSATGPNTSIAALTASMRNPRRRVHAPSDAQNSNAGKTVLVAVDSQLPVVLDAMLHSGPPLAA